MTQPQSRLSGGALSDTAGVERDLDAGATTFTSLPRDLVATQILSRFPDPFDLARLSRVSREMRAAVKATGCELKELNAYRAAKLGYLNMLSHMDSRGRLPKTRKVLLCMAAARSGQLEELKALRAEGCPWDGGTCARAAEGGHLEVLKWARENGCPWDWETCARAAEGGHLEVLKWAHENGCPWNVATCGGAAQGGHLAVLQWARANGAPWSENTREYAASKGYVEA